MSTRLIICVVRRAKAAPITSKNGTKATSIRIAETAEMALIFSIRSVFPAAVRVVVNSEYRAVKIEAMDSTANGIAPFV